MRHTLCNGWRIVATAVLVVSLPQTLYSQDKAGEKTNILFIMSDDHCVQAISAYGGMLAEIAPTPNIDRLAKELHFRRIRAAMD